MQKSKKSELLKVETLYKQAQPSDKVPKRFRLLYKHATCLMEATGASIQIPCDADVFGNFKTIFVLHENIVALMNYQMIGQAAISAYMM